MIPDARLIQQLRLVVMQRQKPLSLELPRPYMPESCFGPNKLEHALETNSITSRSGRDPLLPL